MRLNTLKPAIGSKQKRVRIGRGMGSGLGKTCGFGHKGQKARSGYGRKTGFEGGQMPLQRRLPKFGFNSLKVDDVAEVQLRDLNKIKSETITIEILRKAKLVGNSTNQAKVILAGVVNKPFILTGIKVTAGARLAIENAGGKVE